MTSTMTNSSPLNDSHALTASPEGACKHHTRNGRCRLPVADPLTSLCAAHARRQQKRDKVAHLSAELVAGLTEFKSAIPINDFLSRLLLFQARDRIPPRRAAVMAYTCNLLLRTLPAIDREAHPPNDEPQTIIIDMPGPDRDWPEDPQRAFYRRMSSHSVPNNGETPNATNTKESS